MFGADVLEPFACLVLCLFINYMKYRFAANVHDINKDRVVETGIVMESKFEPAWRLSMLLAVGTVLREMCECLLVKFVACSLKYLLEPYS